MIKRIVIALFLTFVTPAAYAGVEEVREGIVRELSEDGFSRIRMNRTWLGRLRFVGERDDARREIIVNPSTGVILRDYIEDLDDDDDRNRASNSGDEDEEDFEDEEGEGEDEDENDDHDEDDEDEDEEDDDDNSGSGSSNSGSGSSNSGSGSSGDDD